jgi:hypothetical protein
VLVDAEAVEVAVLEIVELEVATGVAVVLVDAAVEPLAVPGTHWLKQIIESSTPPRSIPKRVLPVVCVQSFTVVLSKHTVIGLY